MINAKDYEMSEALISVKVKDIGCNRSIKVKPESSDIEREIVIGAVIESELNAGVKSWIGT